MGGAEEKEEKAPKGCIPEKAGASKPCLAPPWEQLKQEHREVGPAHPLRTAGAVGLGGSQVGQLELKDKQMGEATVCSRTSPD